MKTLVITNVLMYVTQDGTVWCRDRDFGYNHWSRYLEWFDEVDVFARTKIISNKEVGEYCQCDGDKVSVIGFPIINNYLIRFPEVISRFYKVIGEHECAVIEAPSVFTTLAENVAYKDKMPYLLVVTSDPEKKYRDNISGRAFKNQFRMACLRANAVIYETNIQKDYLSYTDKFGLDGRHIDSKKKDVCSKFRTIAETEYTKRTEKIVRKQRKQSH